MTEKLPEPKKSQNEPPRNLGLPLILHSFVSREFENVAIAFLLNIYRLDGVLKVGGMGIIVPIPRWDSFYGFDSQKKIDRDCIVDYQFFLSTSSQLGFSGRATVSTDVKRFKIHSVVLMQLCAV